MKPAVCCLVLTLSLFTISAKCQNNLNNNPDLLQWRNYWYRNIETKGNKQIITADNKSDGISFPKFDEHANDSKRWDYGSVSSNLPKEIPLSLLREMGEARDVFDFMNFVENATVVHVAGGEPEIMGVWEEVTGRFGGAEKNAGIPAKAAICQPENQTVPLVENNDLTVAYYPTCTRIERCGGCCTSPLLVCEPTKKETVRLQVIKTQYNGGFRMSYAGKETLEVERHLECKCKCRVKPEDCNKWQAYDENSCRCHCTNVDDRNKCNAESQLKFWDEASCSCSCRESKPCSTSYYFDDSSCRCESLVSRRVDASLRAAYGERGRLQANKTEPKNIFSVKKDNEDEAEEKTNVPVQRVPIVRLPSQKIPSLKND